MEKLHNGKLLDVIRDVGIILACLLSAISVGTLFWKGGALAQTVFDDHQRIVRIEERGSSTLETHMRLNEQWQKLTEERIHQLESNTALMRDSLIEINKKLAVISDRLDFFWNRANGTEPKPLSTGR